MQRNSRARGHTCAPPRAYHAQQDASGYDCRSANAEWQWWNGRAWQDYELLTCKKLTEAKASFLDSCTIQTFAGFYEVDLKNMTQRNVSGFGQARAVRENPTQKDLAMPAGRSQQGVNNRCNSIDRQRSSTLARKEVSLRSNFYHLQHDAMAFRSQIYSIVHPLLHTVNLVLKHGYDKGDIISVRAAAGDPANAIVDVAQQMRKSWPRPQTFMWDKGATADIFLAGISLGLFYCGLDDCHHPPSFEICGPLDAVVERELDSAYVEFRDKAQASCASRESKQFPSRQGGYQWIKDDNSPGSRLERLAGAVSTLRHGFYQESKRDLIAGTKLLYTRHGKCPRRYNQTTLEHAESDTVLDQAFLQQSSLLSRAVVVVSAASAYQVGGGFLTGGRHALEEAMCMQSDLYFSLQKASELAKQRDLRGHDQRPIHIPETGAVLSPDVRIFRQGTLEGYEFSKAPMKLQAVISIAMPNKNLMVRDSHWDNRSWNELKPIVSQKFETVLDGAMQKQAEVLIIPDVGCGVFKNNPREVGVALGEKLQDFQGVFQKVILTGSREFAEAVESTAGLKLQTPVSKTNSLTERSRKRLSFSWCSTYGL